MNIAVKQLVSKLVDVWFATRNKSPTATPDFNTFTAGSRNIVLCDCFSNGIVVVKFYLPKKYTFCRHT